MAGRRGKGELQPQQKRGGGIAASPSSFYNQIAPAARGKEKKIESAVSGTSLEEKKRRKKKETLTARNRGKTLSVPQEFPGRLFVYDRAVYIEKGPFLRSAVYYVQQKGEKSSPYRPLATEQPTDR